VEIAPALPYEQKKRYNRIRGAKGKYATTTENGEKAEALIDVSGPFRSALALR
jgi:hypothetical protein